MICSTPPKPLSNKPTCWKGCSRLWLLAQSSRSLPLLAANPQVPNDTTSSEQGIPNDTTSSEQGIPNDTTSSEQRIPFREPSGETPTRPRHSGSFGSAWALHPISYEPQPAAEQRSRPTTFRSTQHCANQSNAWLQVPEQVCTTDCPWLRCAAPDVLIPSDRQGSCDISCARTRRSILNFSETAY